MLRGSDEEEGVRRAAESAHLRRMRAGQVGAHEDDGYNSEDEEEDRRASDVLGVAGEGDDTAGTAKRKRPGDPGGADDAGADDAGADDIDLIEQASDILMEMTQRKLGSGAGGDSMASMTDAERLAAIIPTSGGVMQRRTRRKSRQRGEAPVHTMPLPDEQRFARKKLTIEGVGAGEPRNMFYLTMGQILAPTLEAWGVQPRPPAERASVPPSWAFVYNRPLMVRTPTPFPTRKKRH